MDCLPHPHTSIPGHEPRHHTSVTQHSTYSPQPTHTFQGMSHASAPNMDSVWCDIFWPGSVGSRGTLVVLCSVSPLTLSSGTKGEQGDRLRRGAAAWGSPPDGRAAAGAPAPDGVVPPLRMIWEGGKRQSDGAV